MALEFGYVECVCTGKSYSDVCEVLCLCVGVGSMACCEENLWMGKEMDGWVNVFGFGF